MEVRENKQQKKVEEEQHLINDHMKHTEQSEVELWLTMDLRLGQYVALFMDDGWDDMNVIIEEITEHDLVEMGIKKKGHRKKSMSSIMKLKKKENNDNIAHVANPGQEEMNQMEGAAANETVYVL